MSDGQCGSLVPELIESLRLLAAPDVVQKESLPDWVSLPDELGLTFSDVFEAMDTSALPPRALPILLQIDALVASTLEDQPDEHGTGNEAEALNSWQQLRVLAQSALEALGATYEPPDLGFVRYVKAAPPRVRRPRIRSPARLRAGLIGSPR